VCRRKPSRETEVESYSKFDLLASGKKGVGRRDQEGFSFG
jgi:hypothetical protein